MRENPRSDNNALGVSSNNSNIVASIIKHLQRVAGKIGRMAQQWNVGEREKILNASIDVGNGRFVIASPELKVRLWKGEGARLTLNGNVIIKSEHGGDRPIVISIGVNGMMDIQGEFSIGDGVIILIADNARLTVGGRKNESASGITGDAKLLVCKSLDIGIDFICAWNVFITDSDHHVIKGQINTIPVRIGNHVWISAGASVLKGSDIGDGCIIAAHSVVHRGIFPSGCLIAGIPAKVVRSQVEWSR